MAPENRTSIKRSSPTHQSTMLNTSRIAGFSKMSSKSRLAALMDRGFLTPEDVNTLGNTGGLPLEHAESFIENCVGALSLPLGIATNFLIDGTEYFIPMAVEESSVIAAASHGAKLVRRYGGFITQPTPTIATCQIQFQSSLHPDVLQSRYFAAREHLKEIAQSCCPKLVLRGGGVTDMELHKLSKENWFVLHIHVNTCDAMGANIVNTIAEEVGRNLPQHLPCQLGLKILTNLTMQRITHVKCEVAKAELEMAGFSGEEAVQRICDAYEFAELDIFRAATHNKGVMNGIDAVVIATGNDWRAVEAGCHAYASHTGRYRPLTRWWKCPNTGNLKGEITAPIAVGTVGGVTRLHPVARSVLKLLKNPSGGVLSGIIASVGLAQNLSALRALACEGIQKGHMSLHEKNIEMLRRYDHIPQITAVPKTAPLAPDAP